MGLLFGRVPHGVGRPLLSFPAPFGLSWGLIGCVAAALSILTLLYFFGESRHAQGVAEERARNAEKVAEIQANATRAIQEEAEAFRTRTQSLDRSLTRAVQSLEDIPDDAPASDFLLGYARADRSLRNGAGNQ